MKAIKKAIPVEVQQFFKDASMWPAGVYESVTGHFIKTLEGEMRVHDRSYVVTGPAGERWVIQEDVFKNTYDIIPALEVDRPENWR